MTSSKFCHNCGQKTSVEKITFKETLQDFTSSTFSLEAPIFITLKLLLLNPGRLFKAFLSGKRKTYYKPVSFFVLTTVVYLFIRALINYDPLQDAYIIVYEEAAGTALDLARNFMLENFDKMLLLFVFILGLFMKMFFYKKYTLAEFIAVSFYLIGAYTLIATLNMFYVQFVVSQFKGLTLVLMLVYFTFSMLSFFNGNRILIIIKSFILFVLAFICYYLAAFGISNVIVFLKNL